MGWTAALISAGFPACQTTNKSEHLPCDGLCLVANSRRLEKAPVELSHSAVPYEREAIRTQISDFQRAVR